MIDEGYIKYNCKWEDSPIIIPRNVFDDLNHWRTKLFDRSLIGVYKNGIGFGNISHKAENSYFYISASATGNKRILDLGEYALVKKWDFDNNTVECIGKLQASSESLSHAAIYASNTNIKAVIHIHSFKLWEKFLNVLPTTSAEVAYGTPEMANSIDKVLKDQNYPYHGILVMGGHEEGVISFGKDLEDAGEILLSYFTNL